MGHKQQHQWKVLPHDSRLQQLEENLWTLEGTIHKGIPLPRRMVVLRLQTGAILLHNAIALDDAGMAVLEGLGELTWMVVPNRYHSIDAPQYKARYPGIKVICPAGAVSKVRKRVTLEATYEEADAQLANDPGVRFIHLEGIKQTEGLMLVRSERGVTMVFNDALFNLAHMKGLFGLLYGRLLRHAGAPKIPNAFRWVLLKEKEAFRTHLYQLADTENLCRIIPGHGLIIEQEAARILRQVANTL